MSRTLGIDEIIAKNRFILSLSGGLLFEPSYGIAIVQGDSGVGLLNLVTGKYIIPRKYQGFDCIDDLGREIDPEKLDEPVAMYYFYSGSTSKGELYIDKFNKRILVDELPEFREVRQYLMIVATNHKKNRVIVLDTVNALVKHDIKGKMCDVVGSQYMQTCDAFICYTNSQGARMIVDNNFNILPFRVFAARTFSYIGCNKNPPNEQLYCIRKQSKTLVVCNKNLLEANNIQKKRIEELLRSRIEAGEVVPYKIYQ